MIGKHGAKFDEFGYVVLVGRSIRGFFEREKLFDSEDGRGDARRQICLHGKPCFLGDIKGLGHENIDRAHRVFVADELKHDHALLRDPAAAFARISELLCLYRSSGFKTQAVERTHRSEAIVGIESDHEVEIRCDAKVTVCNNGDTTHDHKNDLCLIEG